MSEAHIEYQYEPEGYNLGEHGWYIPDFWLPELDVFIEIKPTVPVLGRNSPTEALYLATGKNVITFYGPPPRPNESDIFEQQGGSGHSVYEEEFLDRHVFTRCGCCFKIRIGVCQHSGENYTSYPCPKAKYCYDISCDPFLLSAYKKAANAFKF